MAMTRTTGVLTSSWYAEYTKVELSSTGCHTPSCEAALVFAANADHNHDDDDGGGPVDGGAAVGVGVLRSPPPPDVLAKTFVVFAADERFPVDSNSEMLAAAGAGTRVTS